MQIALCDDEPAALKTLEAQIRGFCAKRGLDIQINHFSCGEDFLSSHSEYDIVFMDIYLTGISGTDTVRRLCKSNRSQVVFTTISREHALEAFGLNAAHYLVKPIAQQDINQAIERCLLRLGHQSMNILEVKTGQGIMPVPFDNIVYIEVFNKISVIHTKKNVIQTYTSLDTLFELLGESCFLRAQRSFIVNMKFIDSFLFDRLILQGELEIMLSRNKRGKLKNQYQRFLFDLARRGDV